MCFIGNVPPRDPRRHGGEGTRKRHAKTSCATLAATLIACASINGAYANSKTPALLTSPRCAPEGHLQTGIGVAKCSVERGLPISFSDLNISPVLDLRSNSLRIVDINGGLPKLQLELTPPEPVRLASLTPPAAVNPTRDDNERPPRRLIGGPVITGIASTYNPTDPNDKFAGGMETASGELYDILAWTAAIRTDLRGQFGGVRYGRNYKPAYALVESGSKRLVVKINDVGPLRPGRVIDLNERAMRYFDPTLRLGLIRDVRVTPLAGTHWATGPVRDDETIRVAGDFGP